MLFKRKIIKNSFLILFALLIVLSSCNKKKCWECNVYRTYTSTPNADVNYDSTYRMCDYTNDEIGRYSQSTRYDSVFTNAQGRLDTMQYNTSCGKATRNVSNDIWLHF